MGTKPYWVRFKAISYARSANSMPKYGQKMKHYEVCMGMLCKNRSENRYCSRLWGTLVRFWEISKSKGPTSHAQIWSEMKYLLIIYMCYIWYWLILRVKSGKCNLGQDCPPPRVPLANFPSTRPLPAVCAMPLMRHTLYKPFIIMFYFECALLIEEENQNDISKLAFCKNLNPKNLSPENRCQES